MVAKLASLDFDGRNIMMCNAEGILRSRWVMDCYSLRPNRTIQPEPPARQTKARLTIVIAAFYSVHPA